MASSTMTPSKRLASALIGSLIGVLVVAGVGFTLHAKSKDPHGILKATTSSETIDVNGKSYPKATIEMGVYADNEQEAEVAGSLKLAHENKQDWVHYGPSTHLILPANTYITMTIRSYDGGEELNNPYFGKVIGTVDGKVNVDGKDITELPFDKVQHTWTLHGLPTSTQDSLFVNVPLLKVEEDDKGFVPTEDPGTHMKGHTVTFSFLTKGPGEYVWNCQFPCGDGTYKKFGAAMSAYGYMSGKVTVA
jgi:uncharacterized protein YaiE (UPF0345 family)